MKAVKRIFAAAALLMLAASVFVSVFAAEGMPDWYPEDVNSWVWRAADENAPRVVDDADILTPDEEAAVTRAVRSAAEESGVDIVVFTDTTTHGLDISVYAADFYDFNGYGTGVQHDGFCLTLIVNGRDREGWCCVTGAPRGLYTEENAEAIDDVLYGYLGDSKYAEGIIDWAGNIARLVKKGQPFAPDWWPDVGTPTPARDPNAPRVTDETGSVSQSKLEALAERAKRISDKYGVDVAVHFAEDSCGMDRQYYSDVFYNVMGYGDEEGDGILLTYFTDDGQAAMTCRGSAETKLSIKNVSRLIDGAESVFKGSAASAERWLKYLDRTYKTGRTPRKPFVWIIRSVICSVIAWIASGITNEKAVNSMRTVVTSFTAGDHLIGDSLVVANVGDRLLRTEQNRTYSPPVTTSSGGRSGSRSSHSSSYHGSSGTSHSGSGRRF